MKKYIVTYLLLLFTILSVQAQEIRYVKTDGSYSNDGKSWATAKNNVQDAINDLYDVIKNTDKEGHVYVAAGTYYPTESTESDKDGTFYTAFKIYEGVSVYGGFNASQPEATPEKRSIVKGGNAWEMANETILDGNHTLMGDKKNLVWDEKKQQYTTTFLSNSYHVVWFATKGFDANGRANGLSKSARIDGCTIQGGYASNRVTTTRHHNSYGGGVYMVAGSYVDNCVVTQNVSTCGGGAIYMDGGGEVNHSYVRRNQCLGIGADDGFGGGICVDGAGVVRHSMIAENVARIGGGLALLSEEVTSGNRYAPAALGCVVGNNTTMTEAGGVYMRFGGVLNHLTIVNNQCNGPNLVYEGRRYGRSAGIYIDRYGEVFNTVCWGGKIEANSNIQYAAYVRSDQIEKPHVHYSAFTQYEITDWSSTTRFNVIGLAERNSDTAVDANYPDFIDPTTTTGVGIADNVKPQWQPYAYSVLKGSGVMLLDYDYALNQGDKLVHARLEKDMYGTNFVAKTTLGAYVPRSEKFLPAMIDGRPTLFVDPSRKYSHSLTANPDVGIGYSWDCPLGNLNDALYYFSMKEGKEGGATEKKKGRILVKEGELKTTGNYMAGRLRANSLMMANNVEVYGGYPATLTGTATTGRDPIAHPTHISGNIANDDYDNNVHHLVRFQDVSNAVLDGFRLYYGNAYSENITAAGSKHGGGVIVFTYEKTQMSGNALRNCIIANCTGLEGAAVYVTGLGTGGADDVVSLSMENCIIHNNEGKDPFAPSAICAKGSQTTITLNHCTIRGNVGLAASARDEATITLNNSVVHANANVKVDDISTLTSSNVLTVYAGANCKINGSNNLLDNGKFTLDRENNQAILTYASSSANYPSFVNPTRNVGVSEVVDNTVYGGYPNFMPENMSPLVNAAQVVSPSGTDITTNITRNYGGLPDVGAVENTNLPANGTVYYVRKSDGNDSDTGLSWANAFATVSKALEMAEASNGLCKQIWVAAGEYEPTSKKTVNGQKSAYVMLEGVDVFGGFPQTGCPGMEERNPKQYISYLQVTGTKTEKDGSTINKRTSTSIGRVLVQANDFNTETTWNGFAIRHGYLHACYRQNIDGNLNSIDKANVGLAGGAGVYLQANGIIENCTIEDNFIYVYPGGEKLSQSNLSAGGGYHQAGAGVYNSGGTIKNCVIRNNVLEHTLYRTNSNSVVQSAWIYGAGLFMEDGNVFNTIITENECKINDNGGLVGFHEVIVGAGAFLFQGNFYNNTIVSNQANTTKCSNVHISVPGLYVFNNITMYNCVVSGNTSTVGANEDNSKVGYPVASFSYIGGYKEAPLNIKAHYCVVNIGEEDSKNLIKQNRENKNNIFSDPLLDISYLPQNSSPCINMGTEEITGVTIPDVDAGYSERVQDCTIDIGAYEYNGAKNITPAIETTDGVTTAYYYVTQNGRGTATAASPANAACWEKLQKVLDAAGRYKYSNPAHQVVVKLARIQSGGYMPRRSAVADGSVEASNPRTYSIQVPRGVEVWGGYTDDYTNAATHGFLETARKVMDNKTTLNGCYQASGQDVNVYHVVTFTDLVFDTDGKVIADQRLSDKAGNMGHYNKAVLDGLHITGGMANGINDDDRRGGAAIVTDYAHVRNCIVHDNEAAEEGGAFYMKPRSLVSGTLLKNNTSSNRGGAIFVEEPAVASSENYARIFTSTIVKNSAKEGGGVNFETNLRANSIVLWDNTANAQANISGQLDPYSTQAGVSQTMNDYPLIFSAVENLQVAGINNLQVDAEEQKGVRFSDDEYYGIEPTSVLVRTGMRYQEYLTCLQRLPTLKREDFAGISRVGFNNDYIDIGARATTESFFAEISKTNLLTRLYVVSPEIPLDLDLQNTLMNAQGEEIYNQIGSSFANPMNRLDDALEYIRKARKTNISGVDVANTKFEIFVSRGLFYPLRTIRGEYSYSRANTYLVPEGVTIIGGMATDVIYGQGTTNETVGGKTIRGATTADIRKSRIHFDLNNNGIIEPWEMKEQTILSGNNVNSENSENVYHVIAAIPAEQWVGKLPGTSGIANNSQTALESLTADGTKHVETGQYIWLDGLYISDGYAYGYEPNFVGSKHTYFKGGAICVNGNWVSGSAADSNGDRDMFLNTDKNHPLGYRNIPLMVTNCQFSNNVGGMGGAIFSNGDLNIYGCSFTQNYSKGGYDVMGKNQNDEDITNNYTGNGGAINASGRVFIANTLFANNEAQKGTYQSTLSAQTTGGWGGAILAGDYSRLHILNCNFVRNKATNYPAIYNYVANKGWAEGDDSDYYFTDDLYTSQEVRVNNPHRVVNSIFWGNESEPGGIYKSMYLGPEGKEVEHMWFCGYEDNCGLTPKTVLPTDEFDYRKVDFNFHTDADGVKRAAYIPTLFKSYYDTKMGGVAQQDGTAIQPWQVTNNIILNQDNAAMDGPNFINPSQKAGIEGYMVSADWMVSRINNLVDNGWTYLKQDDAGKFVPPIDGSGIYKDVADEFFDQNYKVYSLMPYGTEEYMYYPDLLADRVHHRQMYRISNDPNPTHTATYIDIGIYEYQHTALNPTTVDGMRDILWVTSAERQDLDSPADGSDWLHATSDLQRAIETLLSGRNGHAKEIRMIEGTYMPIYTIGDNLGFKISTSNANNSALATSELKGIQSFTIRGGYSSETADLYDYYEYPVSIMSPERTGVSAEKIKHLLFIEDARQYESVGIGTISHQTTDKVVPIVLEGLNFKDVFVHEQSQGGAAVYYSNQLKDDKKTNGDYIVGDDGTTCLNAPTGGAKRLTIANCSFVKSGSNTNVAIPAVCIGKGGGDALIYNSLFHSNIGSPLLATDTKVINSTFALNGGLVGLNNEMSGYASELHNSVLWKNNQNKVPSVAEISNLASGVVYQHNAFSGIESNGTNDILNDDNDDIFTGPNFFDPENADIALRDFRIKPSAVLLSKASDKTFAMKVLGAADKLELAEYQTAVANTTDLAYFRPRSYGKGLDRGAFECHEQLNRIIYVDPNKMTRTGTGESWENAYEYGRLQNAIDATSVYLITEAADKEEAYVFVKGKREGSTSESITLRNGVQVYGSIDPGYSKQVVETINGGNISYAENNITAYLEQLHTDRPGLAGTHTYRTQVNGVSTTATSYSKQTLLDGFLVSNPNSTDVATVVLNDNTLSEQNHLAMRNCIVAGNRVTGDDEPVVNVGNGLLYNVLVQENISGASAPVVKVGANGRMVNCTVVAHEAGKNTVETVESDTTRLVFNCVTYNVTDNKIGRTETNQAFSSANNTINVSPFAPYLQPGTTAYHADKPEYLTENHYLWYQLHEKAKDLESADDRVNSKLPEKLRGYINLSSDRDVLGNPREVSSMVDRGCFETWQVKGEGSMEMSDAYIPQEGSVVYIQPGASLKLNKAMTQVFRPAYLLLRQGASLYGQGANVELEYVAVERKVAKKGYSLLSLPYDYALGNAVRVNDDDSSGALTETTVDDAKMHTYDGAKRATYSYHFVEDDSPCWIELATGEICPANQGVLLTVDTEGLYRYTAYANAKNNYIYTEGGSETFKKVVLTQYNHTPADNAVFTSLENMGWNLVGMPYLVSNYPTSTPTGNDTYQMNIPHVIYTLDAQGNYSPKQSWDAGADLSIGQAFFTQTATLDDAERLKFQLPVFPTTKAGDTRALLCVAGAAGSDAVQLTPDDDAEELADYQLNYDGVKMMAMNKDLPQVYALNASGSRLALVGSAPVEQEINVGLYAAKADEQYTFSLPNRESFAVYGSVWLKDNHAGIVTDLMTEDYTCMAKMVGRDENRLTIQIGGPAPVISPDGSQIDGNHVVYIRDGVLYISRLIKGQTIQIYTVDGRLIHQTIAEEDTYRTAVSPGIYLVKIDDDRYKAM